MDELKIEQKIDMIEARIQRSPADLTIRRVPKNTLDRFKEIASPEAFCSDYGMALKYLIDFHDGILAIGNEHLEIELNVQRQEIELLKSKLSEIEGNKIEQKSGPKRCGP